MKSFSTDLIHWYQKNHRTLPWRESPSPYHVWVSEIMLQQTRVDTVINYYHRWLQRFPNLKSLAQADQQDVLTLWEGLGYYSRARNLHKAARIVLSEYGGELPLDIQKLRQLPGIGRYTAGAIASLAFGLPEPIVDGNIKRVFSRLFNLDFPVDTTTGEKQIWALAEEHIPLENISDYNQGLMELGALVCLPRDPSCEHCPLSAYCDAYHLGVEEARPVQTSKSAIPHYDVVAAVILKEGNVLVAQRPQHGMLAGLWEFPGGKLKEGEDDKTALVREIKEELQAEISIGEKIGKYKHAYTHFKVTLTAYWCTLESEKITPTEAPEIQWLSPDELASLPMGKIDRQISIKIIYNQNEKNG
ncbi:MAG: A/G-specific adenine glycosylase [Anaerolineales bacterium]|nr:A/G-specific adenine glycosylase [Anaerolineales bacterium]